MLAVTMATKDERWKNYQIYTFGQKDSSYTKYEKNPFFEVCHFLLIFCDCLANPLFKVPYSRAQHYLFSASGVWTLDPVIASQSL